MQTITQTLTRQANITPTDTEAVAVIISPATMRVKHACQDHPHLREALVKAWPDDHLLTGPVARLLFISLAGREFMDDPETATVRRAAQAMQQLLFDFQQAPGFDRAWGCIAVSGLGNCPELGVTEVEELGDG